AAHPDIHFFPTRRSSDLAFHFNGIGAVVDQMLVTRGFAGIDGTRILRQVHNRDRLRAFNRNVLYRGTQARSSFIKTADGVVAHADRKSTRLNSSHVKISY